MIGTKHFKLMICFLPGLLSAEAGFSQPRSNDPSIWTLLGPYTSNLSVKTITFDPMNPNTIYLVAQNTVTCADTKTGSDF
jgi:hypothetical protein